MTIPAEIYSWRLQGPVYGTAFFFGPLHTLVSMVVALLVASIISTELPLLIAFILASRQILTVSLSIYGGALMDHFGTKRIVVLFGLLGAVSALLYPLLPIAFDNSSGGIDPRNPAWLFVAAIIGVQMISGYAEGTSWIGTQTLVSQLFKGHPTYAGRMTFTARTGGILGPFTMGVVWDGLGVWGGFSFLGFWVFCGTIAAMFLPVTDGDFSPRSDKDTAEPAPKAAAKLRASDYAQTFRLLLVPAVALVIMVTVMRQTGSGVQSSFYVVWLDKEIGLSGTLIGSLLATANIVSAVAALSVGRLARYFATHWLLIISIGMAIVGVAIVPALGDVYVLLMIAAGIRGAGQGVNLPMMITILARNVPMNLLGRVTAMRIAFNRAGGALVPLGMGALAELVGIAASFYIIGGAGVIMLCLLSIWVAKAPDFKPAA
jgi:MFS family permease